ncbi:MAG: LysR family transcriptional regulator [Pseudoruegeria sp.]
MDTYYRYIHLMNDELNLRTLDLNLLVVFDAVFRERHVTRAAEKLGMSQPAVSNALQRLRMALKDDLLIKTPAGMEATERAIELAGPIHTMVRDLEDILSPRRFDPATVRGTITVASVDYFNVVIMPDLAQMMYLEAPNMTLQLIPTNGQSVDLLDSGKADLALASFGSVPARFEKQTLRTEGYACVLRHDHPVLTEGLTAQKYAALKHVLHSPGGDLRGSTDDALARLGLKRHIALTVSSFLNAQTVLLKTEMILTAPKSVTTILAQNPRLSEIQCPVEVASSAQNLDMLWHRSFGKRPAVAWLRQAILRLTSS